MTVLETLLECLENNGNSKKDICWVGCTEFIIPTKDFFKIAEKTEEWFGAEIVYDIIVVGKDFWVERDMDDHGGEFWSYRAYPKRPLKMRKISSISFRDLSAEDEQEVYNDIRFGEDNGFDRRELWMMSYMGSGSGNLGKKEGENKF